MFSLSQISSVPKFRALRVGTDDIYGQAWRKFNWNVSRQIGAMGMSHFTSTLDDSISAVLNYLVWKEVVLSHFAYTPEEEPANDFN